VTDDPIDLDGIAPRARRALEVILRIAGGDYSARTSASDNHDSMDAVMVGLNMLAETLEREHAAKRSAEALLADAIDTYDNAPDCFCSCDATSLRIVKCNETMARTLGMTAEGLSARSLMDMVEPGSRVALRAALDRLVAGEPARITEVTLELAEPLVVSVTGSLLRDEAGAPSRFRLVLRDVTVEQRLADQLVHSQRMEAIGRLAGGVAHDFNNLLTVILSAAELVSRSPLSAGQERELDMVRDAAGRAAALTRDLLTFSRREAGRPRAISVDEALTRAEPLLSRLAGSEVSFSLRLGVGASLVQIDPSRLEQALANLIVNARDATPAGGSVLLSTAEIETNEAFLRQHPDVAPGRYVAISVIDTGAGIPASVRERIFEPFFTTKPTGKGTGLGLSMVYGVAQQAGGYVTVDSREHQGTTFRLLLPLLESRTASSVVATTADSTVTILVVEDDERVRAVTSRILRSGGFRVLEAADGRSAIELFDREHASVSLVVSDVMMPGLSGPETITEMRKKRPGLRCLFVTGYAHEQSAALARTGDDILDKPFLPSALLSRVREVLSQ
jgi:PAS domain S-box-containing protein